MASLSSPTVGDTAPEEPEQVPDQESLQPTSTSDAAAVPPPPPAPIPSVITPDETSSQGLQTPSEGEDLNPLELFTSYEDTVNLIHNTTFNGYEFLEITQVESLIKQIPNESPYTDILHHEDEEAHVRGKALTKNELAKMSKEAKILNIANNKKASEIKNYILDKFDRVLVDTMNEHDNNCLFESILCQLANRRFIFKDRAVQCTKSKAPNCSIYGKEL